MNYSNVLLLSWVEAEILACKHVLPIWASCQQVPRLLAQHTFPCLHQGIHLSTGLAPNEPLPIPIVPVNQALIRDRDKRVKGLSSCTPHRLPICKSVCIRWCHSSIRPLTRPGHLSRLPTSPPLPPSPPLSPPVLDSTAL